MMLSLHSLSVELKLVGMMLSSSAACSSAATQSPARATVHSWHSWPISLELLSDVLVAFLYAVQYF